MQGFQVIYKITYYFLIDSKELTFLPQGLIMTSYRVIAISLSLHARKELLPL